jgi:hypothetical protein
MTGVRRDSSETFFNILNTKNADPLDCSALGGGVSLLGWTLLYFFSAWTGKQCVVVRAFSPLVLLLSYYSIFLRG